MAETFGEADVVLRVRLDKLQRELDQSEQLVIRSTERVGQAQQQVMREYSQASDEGRGNTLLLVEGGLAAYNAWFSVGRAIRFVRTGLAAVPAATVAAVSGLIILLGRMADGINRVGDDIDAMVDSFRALDGSQQKALEFSDTLRELPIIGGMASKTFLIFSRDAGKSTEALASLAAKVKDGRVEVGFLGRAVNGLVSLSAPGILLRWLGIDTDIVGQIEAINKEIAKMDARLQVQRQSSPFGDAVGQDGASIREQAERSAAAASIEGIEAARLEERYRHMDAVRAFDELEMRNNAFTAEQLAGVRALRDEGEISHEEAKARLDEISRLSQQRSETIAADRVATEEALNRAAEQRIALLQREQDETERLQRMEQRRTRDAALLDLTMRTGAAQAQLGGDDFEAQRIDLARERARAITDALEQGHEDQLSAIRAYYDARAQLIDAREREQTERDAEAIAERERMEAEAQARMLDLNADLQSRIKEAELRQSGDDVAAQQEAIRRRFESEIKRLTEQGNTVGAELAAKLRDIELAGAESRQAQARGRRAEFDQVSLSRVALGGMGGANDDKKLEREQLEVQKRIAENTKPRPMPAVAG